MSTRLVERMDKEKIGKIFKEIDISGDGLLDRKELHKLFN